MNNTYKALIISGILVLGLFAGGPSQAQDCPQCATEATQLLNKLQLVKQVENSIQQLQAQIGMYQNMVTNSQGVSNPLWSNAIKDLQALNSLIQKSKAIAYSAGNLDSQFASRYSTYPQYLSSQMGTVNWQSKYGQWSQGMQDNALYALKAAGLQSSQLSSEDALIQQLQTMSQSTQGRMQALQVGHMLAEQQIRQVQKLRQLMMLQLQMQANYLAAQQDKDAAVQAFRQQYYQKANPVNYKDGERF
jgi:P-type conjugative transfer protein TrbJ